jgi:hypothetical protein
MSRGVLRAGLKGIRVAISLAALILSVAVFVVVPTMDFSFSLPLAGGKPASDHWPNPEPFMETGIVGNVSIGPIRPVCLVPQGDTNTIPGPTNSGQIVVTSQSGDQTSIPVSWSIWGGCEISGSFKAELAPGTYSLTLSNCLQDVSYPGCSQSFHLGPPVLPITVHVELGRLTPVSIGIDTGIR